DPGRSRSSQRQKSRPASGSHPITPEFGLRSRSSIHELPDLLAPALRRLAQLSFWWLFAQLDSAGIRFRDIRKDAARECAGRSGVAHRQPALAERGYRALDVRRFEPKVIE